MDYTDISKLLSCARMYEHARVERLRPSGERQVHAFGRAWHALHQEWARVQMAGKNYTPGEVAEWVLSTIGWVDDPHDYRNAAKLKAAFVSYFTHHVSHPFTYVEAETSFSLELAEGLEPVEGRIDAIVEADPGWGYGKGLWLVDYKTTSMLRGHWVEFYRVSNQFKYYFAAKRDQYPKLRGVCVDVYHATPGNKRGKTEGEVMGNRFHRAFFEYTQFQLEEAVRDFAVSNTVREMYQELGYWPKNTAACHQFGVACAFLELCEASSEDLRTKLRANYEADTFSPHTPVLTETMP